MGDCFIGESMFSKEPSASKLALIYLAKFMQRIGGKMIDCQLETPHLKSMGGRFIPYEEYMEILNPGALERLDAIPAQNDVQDEGGVDDSDANNEPVVQE